MLKYLFKKNQNNLFFFTFKLNKFYTVATFNTKPSICYYKVLNVSCDATQKEIRDSYLQLCKIHHPDVNQDQSKSEKFKQIQEAYQVIYDTQKRNLYDKANGIESLWSYKNDNIDSKFGDQEEIYQEFINIRKNNDKKNENLDQKVNEYFNNKYFNNREKYGKFPEFSEHPMEYTFKVYKDHEKKVQDKKQDYIKFFAFTPQEYYVKKDEEDRLKSIGPLTLTLYDFRYLIISGFLILTITGVYEALKENEHKKQRLASSRPITEGSGYTMKLLPLNVV